MAIRPEHLRGLEPSWPNAKPTTDKAIAAAAAFTYGPTNFGGIDVLLRDGTGSELEFRLGPDGNIESVSFDRGELVDADLR